jgi:hypothetical protein
MIISILFSNGLIEMPTTALIHTFRFPIPPTLNQLTNLARTHWSKSAKSKKTWTRDMVILCHGAPKFPGKVWAEIIWQPKTFAVDPLDNLPAALKPILDAMVLSGVLKNDNAITLSSPSISYWERGDGEVIITLSESPEFLKERFLKYFS